MGLNKQKGNMYPWVNYTWNPIRGKCPHQCSYCYMSRFPLKPMRLDEHDLNTTELGKGNTIFIGSSCDMFADAVPEEWIRKVFDKILKSPENTYLFQSKNPERFNRYAAFPFNTIWGTTIETNRESKLTTNAPPVEERSDWIRNVEGRKMVSMEPIMDFDLLPVLNMMRQIKPEFISIGADSKGHNIPEPDKEKVLILIDELKKITEVKIKENLKRITDGP